MAYALLDTFLPFFTYLGLLVMVLAGLAAAFWPWVEPRLIAFLTHLREARTRKGARGPRLGLRRSR
jgi:hypothetical protein